MTQTTTKTATCCGKPARTGKRSDASGTTYAVWCETCGRRGIGATEKAAAEAFDKAAPDAFAEKQFYPPARPEDLPRFAAGRLAEFQSIAAPFVRSERSAFARMVKQNVRYVMGLKGDAWNKVWATPEGIQSIIEAIEDAFSLGATLPDMGCFVPYNGIAEFIPSVEAYEFALTTGKSAPFSWIHIEPIYKKDIVEIARVNGAFSLTFKNIPPERGDIISVAVYGHSAQHGHVIGEVYHVERLIEKAKAHSASYRRYLQDLAAYQTAKTEGKSQTENGREFVIATIQKETSKFFAQDVADFRAAEKAGTLKKDGKGDYAEKTIPGKGGKPDWTKKIYRYEIENPGTEQKKIFADEIENPYDGPDRPEMLRKSAGKSFLAKYIRVRNSQAAIDEIRGEADGEKGVEDVLDRALSAAFDQFRDVGDAQEEPCAVQPEEPPEKPREPEKEPEPATKQEEKKRAAAPTSKKDEGLFF